MANAAGYQYVRPIDYEDGYTGAGSARNPNRHGVVIKSIQDPSDKKKTMMEVFMYRAKPGTYYNAHGNEVNEALARMAGFDVDRHLKLKLHAERARMASTLIAQELDVENGIGKHTTVREEAGFKMVDIGLGRYWVEDDHGPLNKGTVLTRQQADIIFDACVGKTRKAAEPAVPPRSGGVRKSAGDELGAKEAS